MKNKSTFAYPGKSLSTIAKEEMPLKQKIMLGPIEKYTKYSKLSTTPYH
jgi:hypothetical protein